MPLTLNSWLPTIKSQWQTFSITCKCLVYSYSSFGSVNAYNPQICFVLIAFCSKWSNSLKANPRRSLLDEGEDSHSLVECDLLSIGFSEEFCAGNVCAGVKGRFMSSISFLGVYLRCSPVYYRYHFAWLSDSFCQLPSPVFSEQ